MANVVQTTAIPAKSFVTSTSRYANSIVEYYGTANKITFATYIKPIYVPSDQDKFMVIQIDYRPDLVSYDVYGSVDFWWKIMEVNNMFDVMQFKAGVTIRLPGNVYA